MHFGFGGRTTGALAMNDDDSEKASTQWDGLPTVSKGQRVADGAKDALDNLLPRIRIAQDVVSRLSDREKSTLALIVRGMSNKQIARELAISPRTVENHRANAFEKISARTTADAVRIGVYAGLDAEI